VAKKEAEYLAALERGENPQRPPIRRFRLPPPPGFYKNRGEKDSPQPQHQDPCKKLTRKEEEEQIRNEYRTVRILGRNSYS
jgi:hypothetical protein